MTKLFATDSLARIAAAMEEFEASASVANTGTGSRREGDQFEKLAADYWQALCEFLLDKGASAETISGPRRRLWARLAIGKRSLFIPITTARSRRRDRAPSMWLDLDFGVDSLVAAFPGQSDAVKRYAPTTGPYAGANYPDMYARMKTKFDDTIVLEDNGVLKEKILLEYKTAKSSRGRQIDGNAHERLSFQIMQYLEVATRYTHCSLAVLANGAFARYRNKYHVNFHIQADRLSSFRWFALEHYCSQHEYARFTNRLLDWLLKDEG